MINKTYILELMETITHKKFKKVKFKIQDIESKIFDKFLMLRQFEG